MDRNTESVFEENASEEDPTGIKTGPMRNECAISLCPVLTPQVRVRPERLHAASDQREVVGHRDGRNHHIVRARVRRDRAAKLCERLRSERVERRNFHRRYKTNHVLHEPGFSCPPRRNQDLTD